MKQIFRRIFLSMLCGLVLTSCVMEPPMIFESSVEKSFSAPEESVLESEGSLPTEETMGTYVKAVWLSQYDMVSVYTANGKQRSAEDAYSLLQVISNI